VLTAPTDLEVRLQNAEQRAEKQAQLALVLEGCFDLLNENIDATVWLGQLAELAGCDALACLWWRAGRPEHSGADIYGPLDDSPQDWINYLEPALAAAQPDDVRLLQGLDENSRLLTDDRMVYCLDHSPVRVIFVFSHRNNGPVWDERDKNNLLKAMRIINKPIKTRSRLSALNDVLDLTNKFIDGWPRACIVLTPDGDVYTSNKLAKKVIRKKRPLKLRDGKLDLGSKEKNAELREELAKVMALPRDELSDYSWHRNLSDSTAPDSCLLTMHAYPFDHWRLESAARDRILVMVIQIHDEMEMPSVARIREFYKLTNAQAKIAIELMRGNSIEKTANLLHVSINTVRTHLRAIYAKVGVANKSQLIVRLGNTLTVPKGDTRT